MAVDSRPVAVLMQSVGACTVECVRTSDGLAALEQAWNRLSSTCGPTNIFMTYSWFSAWTREVLHETTRGCVQLHVLVVRQHGALVGIAPLVRRTIVRLGLCVRKLEFITLHADYNELVLGLDQTVLTHIVMEYLARSAADWDIVDLIDVRDRDGSAEALQVAATSVGLHCRLLTEEDCLYMPIDAPWIETMKRKHLRFARRAYLAYTERVDEQLKIRVVDEPHLEDDLLQRIVIVEAQKQVNGKPSAPVVGRYPELFQKLLDELGPLGAVAIVLVEKGSQLIAWRFLFRSGNELWDYLTAYDRAYAELSPGTLLLCGAIDYGFVHGCTSFDFLRGASEYKLRWTSKIRHNQRLILWNRRVLSRMSARLLLRQREQYAGTTSA